MMIPKPRCAAAASAAVLAYNVTVAAANVQLLADDPTQPLLESVE